MVASVYRTNFWNGLCLARWRGDKTAAFRLAAAAGSRWANRLHQQNRQEKSMLPCRERETDT